MESSLIIAGFGGQGIISAGQILAQAFMHEGLEITWLPAYGAEMRGGTVNCILAFSDDEVASAYIETPEAVISMNLPSFEKFEPRILPGGMNLVNSSLVDAKPSRTDVTYKFVPITEIANEVGNIKTANIVALGAFLTIKPYVKLENVCKSIEVAFGVKSSELVDLNIKALYAGQKAVLANTVSSLQRIID